MDYIVHGIPKNQTQLSDFHFQCITMFDAYFAFLLPSHTCDLSVQFSLSVVSDSL